MTVSKLKEAACEGCGKALERKVRRSGIYCSDECRPTCRGSGCEKPATQYGSTYCHAHYKRFKRHGHAEITAKARNGYRAGKVCKYGDGNPVYAKDTCQPHYDALRNGWNDSMMHQKCIMCDKIINPFNKNGRLVLRQQFYCSDLCAKRPRWKVSIQELMDRDGTSCALCGGEIDFTLKYPDPQSKSIDHVLPRSRGGTDEKSNLTLAHLVCNFRKHNTI